MTKLLIYPLLIFSIVLAGLSFTLKEKYQTEFSSTWVIYTYFEANPNSYQSKASLYQLNLDTGDQYLITDKLVNWGDDIVDTAMWSPDGQWIYFNARDNAGDSHLYRKHFSESKAEVIVENGLATGSLIGLFPSIQWTPDNQWIILAKNGLYRIRPDGSDGKSLTPTQIIYVTISPNSNWLYYYRKNADESYLYRVTIDGDKEEKLDRGYLGQFMGWSADAEWLYFNNVTRLTADGSKLEQISPPSETTEATRYSLTQWSSDKTQFLYSLFNGDPYADPFLFIFDTLSDITIPLIESSTNQFTISPDKHWLYAYDPSKGLYRLPIEENAEIEWLVQTDGFSLKRWTADMSGFYYEIHSNKYRLYYFDIETKQSTYLTQWDEKSHDLSFISPNEKYILLFQGDLCWIKLQYDQLECLPHQTGYEEFRAWQPPIDEKSWHPNTLLLLASMLIVGCSGAGVYWHKRSSC